MQRKRTPKTYKPGKVRLETLAMMELGELADDDTIYAAAVKKWEGGPWAAKSPWSRPDKGVLTTCACAVKHWVPRASLGRRCFVCGAWRKPVDERE